MLYDLDKQAVLTHDGHCAGDWPSMKSGDMRAAVFMAWLKAEDTELLEH